MTKREQTRMNRTEDEVLPATKGYFSFLLDYKTCVVCVKSETDDDAPTCIKFSEGFDGNHSDPTYTKPVDGWSVTRGVLTRKGE